MNKKYAFSAEHINRLFDERANLQNARVAASNHRLFIGSPEACILLLTGEPGTGKSCTIDNWGAAQS